MRKLLYSVYALLCYVIFLGAFLYLIGFVSGILVPKTINEGRSFTWYWALIADLGLIFLFGLQHSVMARKRFKEKWTKIVPKPIERSTYVLFASLALILLYWLWMPLKYTFWDVSGSAASTVLTVISFTGWGILFIATYLINHFDLFGLRQVYLYVKDKEEKPLSFKTPAMYKWVRHPLYLGFLLAFWAAPVMTASHLLFAAGMTSYILVGIWHEEKDLIRQFGEKYKRYRESVPKLIPFTK